MRTLLTASLVQALVPAFVLAILLAPPSPAQAQLAPPNSAGITFAHVHLNVADIEVHKKLWVDHFGGVVVQKGSLVTVKLPGMLVVLREREPTGDSEGSVMDHIGLKVRNIAEAVEAWRAAGHTVMREFTGIEDQPNAYLLAPDGIKIELQEDRALAVRASAYHVHFYTSEYAELMDWYVDLFSLEPRTRGTIETTADVPGMNLSFSGTRTERASTQGRAVDHIGFEVDDLEAFCDVLSARGIT